MGKRAFTPATRGFTIFLLAGGLAAAGWMLLSEPPRLPDELPELCAFLGLGVFWSLLTFRIGRAGASRVAVTLAPAAYLALVPIASAGLVTVVALVLLLMDWLGHRRRLWVGLYNAGQILLGIAAAVPAARAVADAAEGAVGIALAAVVGAVACSGVSVLTMALLMRLHTGRPLRESGIFSYSTLSNEAVVGCFSAMMALSWSLHELLLPLAVVPLTLLFRILSRLDSREADLERRQRDLQTIQELGLQVSAELDASALAGIVSRLVSDYLGVTGALVATLVDGGDGVEIAGRFDRRPVPPTPPRRMPRRVLDDTFLAGSRPLVRSGSADLHAELAWLGAGSLLLHPLVVLGRTETTLVVYDDGSRGSFGEEDCERLAGFVRFVEVALNNARLYSDLRQMQEQLVQSEKMSALGQLVSGVAHELNNPLAAIMGSSELLGHAALEPPAEHMVGRIHREAGRAARIVRNLLTFSRHQKPDRGWHRLDETIADLFDVQAPECERRGILLATEIEPELPWLRFDPDQVHQVLVNLVQNAVHAIEDAGAGGTIVVRARRQGARVLLEVSDDGPGIAEENLSRIFNPFFTTKKPGKGTGLGLSICYGIVKQHEGALRVRSTPGAGTRFTIDLPVPPAEARAHAAEIDAGSHPVERPADGAGRKVLVVDDEVSVREMMSEALALWGFAVDAVGSGEEALERMVGEAYELVISDLRMPGLGGPELHERSLDALGDRTPPFLFTTGDAASPDVRAFLESTSGPVLVKPFTLVALRENVEVALARDDEGVLAPA